MGVSGAGHYSLHALQGDPNNIPTHPIVLWNDGFFFYIDIDFIDILVKCRHIVVGQCCRDETVSSSFRSYCLLSVVFVHLLSILVFTLI